MYFTLKVSTKTKKDKFIDVCFFANSWDNISEKILSYFKKLGYKEMIISEHTQRAYNFEEVKPHRVIAAWKNGSFYQIKINSNKNEIMIDNVKVEAVRLRPVIGEQAKLF